MGSALLLVEARALAASPAKVIYEEMIMTNDLISMSMLKTDSPRKMIPEPGRKFSPCWVKSSYGDIAPSKARRNHGSCGLGHVRIGCGHTRAVGLRQASLPCPSDTRVQLVERTARIRLVGNSLVRR